MIRRPYWKVFAGAISTALRPRSQRITPAILVLAVLSIAVPPALASMYRTVHSFDGSDGRFSYAGLTLVGSALYGTTDLDGANVSSQGTVFSMNLDGTNFQTVRSFTGGSDGGQLTASLTLVGSTLYGTASGGGINQNGTVFSMNLDGSNFHTLHNFTGGADGSQPAAALTLAGSILYGTASHGGATGNGTVFSVNVDGSNFQTLHSFTGSSDGSQPVASLAFVGSTLYGTAASGGPNGSGTVFSISLNGSNFQMLHSFLGASGGSQPVAALTPIGSTLYGTAATGGNNTTGTIFSMNLDGSNFRTVHAFSSIGSDGAHPEAGLTLVGATLYGTTSDLGAAGYGTVFSMNSDGSNFQTLHAFSSTGNDGARPFAALTPVGSMLYGTTAMGGANALGTVFAVTIPEPSAYAIAATALVALLALVLHRRISIYPRLVKTDVVPCRRQ